MMKRLSLTLTLGLTAAVIGVIVGPQSLFVGTWLFEGWLPVRLMGIVELAAFEIGLWGSGLAVCLVGRRLGWITRRVPALIVTASPVLAEGAWAAAIGEISPGLGTALGIVMRLVVAIPAIAIAFWSLTWSKEKRD